MQTLVGIALAVAAGPVLAGWAYLAFLSLAALRYSRAVADPPADAPSLVVLIPAHNEASAVGECVRSLVAQRYPAERRRIVVIADNCTDSTQAEAVAAGAEVMVRHDEVLRGKGRALRWAMDGLIREAAPADAFVIVDADSIAEPDLLEGLARALRAGHQVAQADYTVLEEPDATSGDRLRALAILVFNRTRNMGRATLGLPAALLGNGMMLSRSLVDVRPWTAYSPAEDLEFGIETRLAGVRPVFVPAGVRGPMPIGYSAGAVQRERWEGGRWYVLRRLGPELLTRLLRHPDASLLDAFLDLAVPPIAVMAMVTGAGLVIAAAAVMAVGLSPVEVLPWATAAALAVVHVSVGLRAAGAPPGSIAALRSVPGFVWWKLRVYARLLFRGFDPNRWQRSLRKGESA